MEFHGPCQEKIEKTFWPRQAGLDWPGEPHRALRPVWPARVGLGSLNLCKLNGGSTAEVKELGRGWESTTGSGWHGNLVFQMYRARTSSGGAIPPAGCHFYFASSKWRKWSGSKRIASMEVHGMHIGNRKPEFHGIHGSGTRNWNLDTHEIHGIHDFHGISLKFHGIPLDCLDFHGIP